MRKTRSLGFSLIEMMVGVLVAALVMLGAVAFSQSQIRALGKSNQVLEMVQTGRASMDLLLRDLENSGAGVSHTLAGEFAGVTFHTNTFSVPGAVANFGMDQTLATEAGTLATDDLMLMMADGEYVSIVGEPVEGANIYDVCNPSKLRVGDRAVLVDEVGFVRYAAEVISLSEDQPCPANVIDPNGTCAQSGDKCDQVEVAALPSGGYESTPGASSLLFSNGSIKGQFKAVIWFVVPDADGKSGELRRVANQAEGCAARDRTRGDLVADNIEAMQWRMNAYDTTSIPPVWNDVTGSSIDGLGRPALRIDVELVVRARGPDVEKTNYEPVKLRLASNPDTNATCVPADPSASNVCNVRDEIRRMAFRSSVYLRNSNTDTLAI